MPQRITLFRVRDEFRWFPAPEVSCTRTTMRMRASVYFGVAQS
jgi:hypothetical protein